MRERRRRSFEANIGKNHFSKREDIRAEYLARRKALGVSDEPEALPAKARERNS